MEVWFNENPDLLDAELKSLTSRNISYQKDEKALAFDRLRLFCTIPKGEFGIDIGETLDVEINFPDNYPYFRPEVLVKNLSLPRHQHPSQKNLCLLPRPSQFWDVTSIGEYLETRLPIVFSKGSITDLEEIASDLDEQAEPWSEYFISHGKVALMSDRPYFFNDKIPNSEDQLKLLKHGFVSVSYPKSASEVNPIIDQNNIEDSFKDKIIFKAEHWFDENNDKIGPPFPFANNNHTTVKTRWYMFNKFPSFFQEGNKFEDFYNFLRDNGHPLPKKYFINTKTIKFEYIAGLIFPEEIEPGKIGWGWMFVCFGKVKKKKLLYQINIPVYSIEPEDLSVRIPDSSGFKDKTISIVGLGTLGAFSAIEFAKNGVAKLRLLDFDTLDTTSSVRWPLGYKYIGQNKAIALKQFLAENYPAVTVEVIIHKIGSTEDIFRDKNKSVERFIDDTDLVYDATAEEGVSHYLSKLCWESEIPFVSIEGRRGALGGIVAKINPGESNGCWMCLQHSLFDNEIIPPPEDKSGGIQPRGCGDITFTGSSYDMYNISLAGVRLVAQFFKGDKLTFDIGVLSMVDEKKNPVLPNWKMYNLQTHPKCPYCNDKNMD